jgi:hypothetical protein
MTHHLILVLNEQLDPLDGCCAGFGDGLHASMRREQVKRKRNIAYSGNTAHQEINWEGRHGQRF